VVDAFAVGVEKLPHDRAAGERLHDLPGDPVVGGEAHRQAEGARRASVGGRGQVVVVEGVDPKGPDAEPYQAGHGALVVFGHDAHFDDLAQKRVAEGELTDHRR